MGYYSKTSVYLTKKQKEILTRYMPYKMSSMIRDVIDVILSDEKILGTEELRNNKELRDLIKEYQVYLSRSQETFRHREELRHNLYEFLDLQRIPYISSRKNGHKIAITRCQFYIPAFRNEGYIISDNLAHQLIIDYVHMNEDTGREDAAWQEYQTAKDFKEREAEYRKSPYTLKEELKRLGKV